MKDRVGDREYGYAHLASARLQQRAETVAGLLGGTNTPQPTDERVAGTWRSDIW